MDSTGPLIIEFEGICPVDSSMSSSPVSSALGASELTVECTPGIHPGAGLIPVGLAIASVTVPPPGGEAALLGGPGPSGSVMAVKSGLVSHSTQAL